MCVRAGVVGLKVGERKGMLGVREVRTSDGNGNQATSFHVPSSTDAKK